MLSAKLAESTFLPRTFNSEANISVQCLMENESFDSQIGTKAGVLYSGEVCSVTGIKLR